MKVLLCEAPYNYGVVKTAVEKYFPLGIGYISAYLNKNGIYTDMFLGQPERLEEFLLGKRFDIIGISSMTPSFINAVKMAQIAKRNSEAKIVVGGQHASALREKILEEYPEFDYLVYGEGERTFLELCTRIQDKNKNEINGLVWKTDKSIITNSPRIFIDDLDSLPYPRIELAKSAIFGSHAHFAFEKSAPMITSRGCPHRCTYCSSRNTLGEKYRYHSAEYITSQLEYLYKEMKVKNIVFWDDTLTALPERLEQICKRIIEKQIHIQWYCLSRIDSINKELLILMKKAGMRLISFGIESGSKAVQEKIKKRIPLDKAEKVMRICEKLGIKTQATFIFGFSFETLNDINETIKFAKKLSPTIAIFFSLVPFPGSEVFDTLPLSKRPMSLDEWRQSIATGVDVKSYNDGISSQKLQYLINKAYVEFYIRPSQIIRIIKTLKFPSELAGYAKSALALTRRVMAGRS